MAYDNIRVQQQLWGTEPHKIISIHSKIKIDFWSVTSEKEYKISLFLLQNNNCSDSPIQESLTSLLIFNLLQ